MDDIRLMEDKVQRRLRKFWRDKRIEEGVEVPDDSDISEVEEGEDTPEVDGDASQNSPGGRSRTASRMSNKDTTGLLMVSASPVDPARTSVSASVNNIDISINGASAKSIRKAGRDVLRAGSLFKLGDGIINTSWNER